MKREEIIAGANWVSMRGDRIIAYDKRGRKIYVIKGDKIEVRGLKGRGRR